MSDNTNNITTVFSADISNFSKSTQELKRYISTVNAEFQSATAGMDDWSKTTDGLEAKLKQLNGVLSAQKAQLSATEEAYEEMKRQGKENTAEGQKLYIKLRQQEAQVKKTEASIEKYSDELENLDNNTEKAEKSTSKFGETLGNVAKGAVAGIAGAVTGFFALAEATRETRQELGILEASFKQSGHSAESAHETYNTLFGVLGDSGQATEASQLLATLANDEEELAQYTDILTGVYATFGKSLPVEGLAEAMNHTAELGSVQGNLADALEWSGVNVDDFNAQLAECNSVGERQALITETLNGLYGEASENYKEVNKDLIEANEAQAELTKVTAELGAIAEPIMTTLKLLAVDLLETIKPFVELMGEGLKGALEGDADAVSMLAEGVSGLLTSLLDKVNELLPTLAELAVNLISELANTILANLPMILETGIQVLMTLIQGISQMLPSLIPAIVNAVILIVETLLDNIDMIIDAGINLILALADGLMEALPQLIDKIPIIIDKLMQAISSNLPKLVEAGINLILTLAKGLIQAIPQLLSKIPEIIGSIVRGFGDYAKNMGQVGLNLIKGIWQGIKDGAKWLKDKIFGFAGDVAGWFKKVFKIHSPSQLMADEVGKYLGEGIGVGILDSIPTVKKQLGQFSNVLSGQSVAGALVGAGNVTNSSSVTVYQTFEKMPTTRYALRQAKLEAVNALRARV